MSTEDKINLLIDITFVIYLEFKKHLPGPVQTEIDKAYFRLGKRTF